MKPYYLVDADVMRRVIARLATLPYAQVHELIEEIQATSRGPFDTDRRGPAAEKGVEA
jgi:hypothetical protein